MDLNNILGSRESCVCCDDESEFLSFMSALENYSDAKVLWADGGAPTTYNPYQELSYMDGKKIYLHLTPKDKTMTAFNLIFDTASPKVIDSYSFSEMRQAG